MPPRRKPDAAAAKTASPTRPQISELRRVTEGDTVFPRPTPLEAMASGEDNDGRTHATDNIASPRDSARGLTRRSGEKSATTGRTPGAGGKRDGMRSENPEGSKSRSSAPLSPDAQARHNALVAAKALMQFPPKDGDPKIYQEWRARMEALLDYADGGPRPDRTRAPTIDGCWGPDAPAAGSPPW